MHLESSPAVVDNLVPYASEKVIKNKVGPLNLAVDLVNISKARRMKITVKVALSGRAELGYTCSLSIANMKEVMEITEIDAANAVPAQPIAECANQARIAGGGVSSACPASGVFLDGVKDAGARSSDTIQRKLQLSHTGVQTIEFVGCGYHKLTDLIIDDEPELTSIKFTHDGTYHNPAILETMFVSNCPLLKEIIIAAQAWTGPADSTGIGKSFKELRLYNLPNLIQLDWIVEKFLLDDYSMCISEVPKLNLGGSYYKTTRATRSTTLRNLNFINEFDGAEERCPHVVLKEDSSVDERAGQLEPGVGALGQLVASIQQLVPEEGQLAESTDSFYYQKRAMAKVSVLVQQLAAAVAECGGDAEVTQQNPASFSMAETAGLQFGCSDKKG